MEASPHLARLIRERRDRIIAAWSRRARARPIAQPVSQPYLTDSIPDLLDDLADSVEKGTHAHIGSIAEEAAKHAQQRLGLGYNVGELIAEYIDLRQALQETLADTTGRVPAASWNMMNQVLDEAGKDAVDRFSRAREHRLHVLERVSSEPLTAPNLEALLEYLLAVMAEVASEVDTVTILLREGNALHVRASRGLEEEIRRSFTVAIGDGFAGTVAAKRQPVMLRDAARDPLVKSDVIRQRGLKALYGVPLVDSSGELIGVAHMGSTTACDFQEEDLILFQALCNRATALIGSRRQTDQLLLDEQQRERFIGVLGHDLRSPLAAVLGSAHTVLRFDPLDERVRRSVARIARAGERMARLIDDLLDFTRARVGDGIPIQFSWVNLGEVAHEVIEELRSTHPHREVRLTSELRSPVCCDGDRVAQVIANLVSNALLHGAPDTPIDVTLRESGSDAVITVHNEGPPIPPDLLAHLFEPFRRGAADGAPGVGLGLFIVDALMVAHGGSVEARSEAGRGTTFIARLPKEHGA